MNQKLFTMITLCSLMTLSGCDNEKESNYPKDKDGNPTNLMPESTKTLEFNTETIVSQVNKTLPDLMYYDHHFDSASKGGDNQVNYYFSRTQTTAEQMIADGFEKTQKEEDCKTYNSSTAWYYEECRKRNISIQFHWRDNTGKEVFSHVCGK